MNEYDLPLTEECETCCGKGFLYYNIKSAFTYETKACHNCGGTGNFALKKLELDYDKEESNEKEKDGNKGCASTAAESITATRSKTGGGHYGRYPFSR